MSGGYSDRVGWLSDIQIMDEFDPDCTVVSAIFSRTQGQGISIYIYIYITLLMQVKCAYKRLSIIHSCVIREFTFLFIYN